MAATCSPLSFAACLRMWRLTTPPSHHQALRLPDSHTHAACSAPVWICSLLWSRCRGPVAPGEDCVHATKVRHTCTAAVNAAVRASWRMMPAREEWCAHNWLSAQPLVHTPWPLARVLHCWICARMFVMWVGCNPPSSHHNTKHVVCVVSVCAASSPLLPRRPMHTPPSYSDCLCGQTTTHNTRLTLHGQCTRACENICRRPSACVGGCCLAWLGPGAPRWYSAVVPRGALALPAPQH